MKSVLISIQPKWCELIASGKKTIEVRKSAPKEAPFKAYIYCTKGTFDITNIQDISVNSVRKVADGRGKVIGEFICDKVEKFTVGSFRSDEIEKLACLTYEKLIEYFYKPYELDGSTVKFGYAWHISDLKIYDKPKGFEEFVKPCDWNFDCCTCKRAVYELTKAEAKLFYGCDREITRAPQSWQYVEEV